MCLYADSLVVDNGLANSELCERNMTEKLLTRDFGGKVCGYTFLNGQKHEDMCVACECSPKSDLGKGGF